MPWRTVTDLFRALASGTAARSSSRSGGSGVPRFPFAPPDIDWQRDILLGRWEKKRFRLALKSSSPVPARVRGDDFDPHFLVSPAIKGARSRGAPQWKGSARPLFVQDDGQCFRANV